MKTPMTVTIKARMPTTIPMIPPTPRDRSPEERDGEGELFTVGVDDKDDVGVPLDDGCSDETEALGVELGRPVDATDIDFTAPAEAEGAVAGDKAAQ
jgi:hypothetical protein